MSAQVAELEMLVVGKDVDGSWAVRESGGMLLGRFASCEAAHRFAERERRSRPSLSIAFSAGTRIRLRGRLTLASGRKARGDASHDS